MGNREWGIGNRALGIHWELGIDYFPAPSSPSSPSSPNCAMETSIPKSPSRVIVE
ncbi:MAG: hypothetical protein V7K67_34475 [Nostoc sp.]|uniref:hypothetical protein n=1 Tax=Nostoc sp. TaxID=1180 RepID=UPI002FF5E07C